MILSHQDEYTIINTQSISGSFAKFQEEREQKVNQVVAQSWMFGKYMHWDSLFMTKFT